MRSESEMRARELLAAEYRRDGQNIGADRLLAGHACGLDSKALRAIAMAITHHQPPLDRDPDLLQGSFMGGEWVNLEHDLSGVIGWEVRRLYELPADRAALASQGEQQGLVALKQKVLDHMQERIDAQDVELAEFRRAAPQAVDPEPRPMAIAPRDGTMLRLLVQFEDHATEDTDGPAWTIGANSFDNTGEDVWQFAGWCWTHDHFTEGKGTPIGWLPLLDSQQKESGDV